MTDVGFKRTPPPGPENVSRSKPVSRKAPMSRRTVRRDTSSRPASSATVQSARRRSNRSTLVALTVVAGAVAVTLVPAAARLPQATVGLTMTVFAVAGAVIVARRPGHVGGWLPVGAAAARREAGVDLRRPEEVVAHVLRERNARPDADELAEEELVGYPLRRLVRARRIGLVVHRQEHAGDRLGEEGEQRGRAERVVPVRALGDLAVEEAAQERENSQAAA